MILMHQVSVCIHACACVHVWVFVSASVRVFVHACLCPSVHVFQDIIFMIISTQLERLVRLKEIEDIAAAKKESLKAKLQLTVQMLADAYDR